MLTALLVIPILGAISLLLVNDNNKSLMKQLSLGFSLINFILSLLIWGSFNNNSNEFQFVQEWGSVSFCHLNLGIDGISLFFVLLTTFIIPICILSNWDNIKVGLKYYLVAFLILESLLLAVFVVLDLLLFYITFESVLIPLFIIVVYWGGGIAKVRAGTMLFLYTLFGSLFMLLAILTIYFLTGTTDFLLLSTIEFNLDTQKILWLAFLMALAIKVPLVPFHVWLPFAHVAAPLGGSVVLAGVVLKLASYSIIRVLIPFFPDASLYFTPLVYTLAVISIIYPSLTCLRTINIKAIIAYSSIAHMSVSILGFFSNNLQGIEGAIMLSLAHGITSPALFILVGGVLYNRTHSLNLKYYRGLAMSMPLFAVIFFVFTLANIGVPLTANFIGEFMSFAGAFQENPIMTSIGASGMVLAAAYSVWLYNKICFGSNSAYLSNMFDLNRREFILLLTLLTIIIILGVYPNIVLDSLHLSVSNLIINSPLELTSLAVIPILPKNIKKLGDKIPPKKE